MRGGERVIDALCELFPDADVYTHVYDAAGVSPRIARHRVRTTFISRLPFARRLYKLYLPLMPAALRALQLKQYDLIISSEAGPAKGVVKRKGAVHVCYCHTPMRYAWGMEDEYLGPLPAPVRFLARIVLRYMRSWDVRSARGVDHFVANSKEVAGRIRTAYGRDADVVHPPVDVDRFKALTRTEIGDYYLVVSHLVAYKRIDLAVDACTRLQRPLVIIGTGEQLARLRARAGPTVRFLEWQSDEEIAGYYSRCRALLFPGLEDFGITPLEAMASGRPVVAYGKGGATETVIDGKTGILFQEQTVDALCAAIDRLERREKQFDPTALRAHANQFSREAFLSGMQRVLQRVLPANFTPRGVAP